MKKIFLFLIFLIVFQFFFVILLSLNSSEIDFYGFKWHYSSTPIGIIHSYILYDEELVFNREYLNEVSSKKEYSKIQFLLSSILFLSSILGIFMLIRYYNLIEKKIFILLNGGEE